MENVLSGANLQIVNVSKRFGKHPVLWNFSLDIAAGQFVAIVGRSGCGKSTLLRLLAGLDQPTQGEIRVDGRPLRQLNRAARVMFQDARLLLWRNVQDNVALGLKHKAKERSLWALQQVGLAARGQDWPTVLSGGQRQRVALARALVGQPQLMLLDEPLGALDALTRIEMQYLIEQLWLEQQFTVLLVTHDVEEAVALADRVIMLDEGSVALDLQVNLPRPRDRAAPEFVTLTQSILGRIGLPAWGKVEIPSSMSSLY